MSDSPFSEVRALLLQVRNTEDIEAQEQECFLERTTLHTGQLDAINLARVPLVDRIGGDTLERTCARLFETYHVIFIGGAGEYSAVEDYEWMPDALGLLQRAADRSFPVFGSCWGHQLIARALGGHVIHDLSLAELGCLPVFLTEEGMADPLFTGFPTSFKANMGHHDRVERLPPDAVELARGVAQPNEAFRIKGKPIYGTQFHSELNAERERDRLIRYRPYYRDEMPDEETFQQVVNSLEETTEVDGLMYDFLKLYVA